MTKTAQELGISEEKRAALEIVARMLESGEIVHRSGILYSTELPEGRWFNMDYWVAGRRGDGCGRAACIGGWAEQLTSVKFTPKENMNGGVFTEGSEALEFLFYPGCDPGVLEFVSYDHITAQQAARAIHNYLETGHPRWREALSANGQ